MKKNLSITLKVDAKTGQVTAVRNSFDKLDKKVRKTNQSLMNMKKVFGSLSVILGAKMLGDYADTFTNINNRIKLVTDSEIELVAVRKSLLAISNDARVEMDGTSDLYRRMAQASEQYGISQERVLGITALISKSLTISGGSAESAKAAMLQLSQGFASGTLRGQELNSVMEQAPRLAKAIADGMGIAYGDLRKVAETGGLTTVAIMEALESQGIKIGAEFAQTNATIAQSFTIIENNAIEAVGTIDEALGASASLTETLSDIAVFIATNTDAITQGFLGIKIVFQVLKQDFFQMVVWIDAGIQNIGQAWYDLTATMQNAWKVSADTIGQVYYDLVNYILQMMSATINNVSDALGGAFEFVGADNPFGKINLSIGEYQSTIKEATADTFVLAGTDWAKSQLTQSASGVLETYNKLKSGIYTTSETHTKAAKNYVKNSTKTTESDKKGTKALKNKANAATKALKQQRDLQRKYMTLTDDKAGLFSFDVEDTMKEFVDSGRYSGEQLSKIYDAMWDKYQDKGKESASNVHTWLKDAFDIDSDSVFGKLFDDFSGLFDGLLGVLKSDKGLNGALADMDLGVQATGMLQKSGDPTMAAIGYSLEAVGALLSNTLSEAELKRAAGRSEFESQSLTTMRELAEQNPLLPLTSSMLLHLTSMDAKFDSIAKAISSTSNRLDLDGSDFQGTASYGALGFSSKTSELLGAGIEFGKQTVSGFLDGVDAVGYEAIKVSSSSFWGLVKNEKIKENMKALPDSLKDDIAKAFGESIMSVMDAVEILGFDTVAIQAKLDKYVLDLGKLNFKDLDASEQSKALSAAMSEQLDSAFSQAISSIASPQNIIALENMALAGEAYTETLVRAAVQHEYVTTQFAMYGQVVEDFATSDHLVQLAGGLEQFKSATATFISNFFSPEEQAHFAKRQLEMALAVHNIGLPASKAQFRQLVLETQQKIISLKTNIETMKAGIRADIQTNRYKIEADGNYARSAVNTANNINAAAVLIGTSANDMIEAAKGASKTASTIDYTDAYQADVGLQALESELGRLDGIYATLMSNMGAFADYYGEAESTSQKRVSDAQEKLSAKRKQQIELINKEIEARNKLNQSIQSMQDGVYGSFQKLLGKDIPTLVSELGLAINNKDYGQVSSAFSAYTTKLGDTASSKEQYLRGIIGANALVQGVQGQEQMTLLNASLATEANTRETAYLNRVALGLQKDTQISTEKENKLDRNNKLLEELIKLQKEANGQSATGLDIQAAKKRDAEAVALRAKYGEAS